MDGNIPTNIGSGASGDLALEQNQIDIAKAQKKEKLGELYTEPLRMVGQEMIGSGAKGLGGYLVKKTGMKSFSALASNVGKHGLANGLARTVASAGSEAAEKGGKAAQDAVTSFTETHKNTIYKTMASAEQKVKSTAEDLSNTVSDNLSKLKSTAEDTASGAVDAGKAVVADAGKAVSAGQAAIGGAVSAAQDAAETGGKAASAAVSSLSSISEDSAQSLGDLNMLPGLPSSAAAGRALLPSSKLAQAGVSNVQRGAARASSVASGVASAEKEVPSLVKAAPQSVEASVRTSASVWHNSVPGQGSRRFLRTARMDSLRDNPASRIPDAPSSAAQDVSDAASAVKDVGDDAIKATSATAPVTSKLFTKRAGGNDPVRGGKDGLGEEPTETSNPANEGFVPEQETSGLTRGAATYPANAQSLAPSESADIPTEAAQGEASAGSGMLASDSGVNVLGEGTESGLSTITEDSAGEKAAEGGAEKGLAAITADSTLADENPIGDVVTGVLGVATLVAGLFAGHGNDTPTASPISQASQSFTAGASSV